MKTKTCTNCGEEKSQNQFQVRRASKDGLTAKCKKCLSEYDKERFKSDPRVKARHKAYQKTDKGKEAVRRAKRKYVENNLVKRSAHIIIGNALRDGKVTKSACEICGSKESVAHHDDYSKPLEVRWLCVKHHKQWHKVNGEGLSG